MTIDVVIAGAGPNGLFLACELRRAGVKPVVLERLPEPARRPKANGLVGRVVQMLDYRGLYERLSGGAGRAAPVPMYQFAGFPLELASVGEHPLRLLMIPQPVLEARLGEYAREIGVEIRRGHELLSLDQDDDGVTLEVDGPEGVHQLRARYLVGADGGHSVVRKQAGIGFPGSIDEGFVSRYGRVVLPQSAFVPGTGELELPGGQRIWSFQWHRTSGGAFAFAPLEAGTVTVAASEWNQPPVDDSDPVTLDELRTAVHRVTGLDLPIGKPEGDGPFGWTRLVGNNTRLADRYREGRILLLGDAAHVHSAVGGPGLNLGLQDALNLGWKLGAEIQGWAPPGLLDTYHGERHPVGEGVVQHTRAQMALLSPGQDITAVRALFGELLGESGTRRRVAEILAGEVRYPVPDSAHPLTGRWMPDLPLGSTRVGEVLRSAKPVLLDFIGQDEFANVSGPWKDRVNIVASTTSEAPADAVLIRPDGYVAWAGGKGEHEELRTALETWFGAV